MGSFVYTATDELVAGHDVGDSIVLEVGVTDAVRSRAVEKSVQRSAGGAMEVLKHRADVTWGVTLEPVWGSQLRLVREFLASTEGGEAFSMDLYGDSSSPKLVKRMDDSYDEQSFMRRGAESLDAFTISFQVLEI